ncbi:MAG: methyltransferase domain-containing protein [Acidimicrobiia bacterium]|nr:methyltransferase domain-containing protein [Acidimicrobiia bacterium]
MADEWTAPLTVEQMYGYWDVEWDEAMALTDRSLGPRPSTSIYDTLSTFGVSDGDVVLDIGGRDAGRGLVIAERFGCRVIVVDPVQANLDEGLRAVAGHDHGDLVEIHQGTINQIPVGDNIVDVVFSIDMLTHVEDLDGALIECRRVLTPSGSVLIYQVFETPLLEPAEKARICADLATVPDRLSVDGFEDSVHRAGFTIQAIDRIGPEFLESLLEREDGEKRLLRAARMQRANDDIVAKVGVAPFRVMRANNLWTIYRMIGKLEERVYSLTLEGT